MTRFSINYRVRTRKQEETFYTQIMSLNSPMILCSVNRQYYLDLFVSISNTQKSGYNIVFQSFLVLTVSNPE